MPNPRNHSVDTNTDGAASRVPVVIFAALSSPDEKDSVASQIAHVRERLVAPHSDGRDRFEVAEPFEDEDATGWSGDRGPGLAAAIEQAERAVLEHGRCDLWVYNTSRLGRGSGKRGEGRAYAELWWELRRAGVQVRSVSDDEYATNEVLVGIASTQHNKFSEDKSAHVRRGKRQQLEKLQRLGGPLPDGYGQRIERDEKDEIVDREYFLTDRAPVIEYLFSLAAQGMSDSDVAVVLNRAGLRTAQGRPWTRRRIQDTILNPYYGGYIAQRGENVGGKWRQFTTPRIAGVGSHPAIVDPGEWERIIRSRALRDLSPGDPARRRPGRPRRRDVGTDLYVCARCGALLGCRLSPYRRKRDGRKARRYVCPNSLREIGLCTLPLIDAELLDGAIIRHISADLLGLNEWHESLLRGRDARREAVLAELEADGAALAKLERVLPVLRSRVEDAIDGGDAILEREAHEHVQDVIARRAELRERIAAHESKLDALADEHAPADAMLDAFSRYRDALQGLDGDHAAEANGRLRRLFDRFEIDALDRPHRNGAVVRPALRPSAFLDVIGEPTDPGSDPLILTTDDGEAILPPLTPFGVPGGGPENKGVTPTSTAA